MTEWISQFTPQELAEAIVQLGWRLAAIVGGSFVLVAWARAFQAKWGKRP